MLSPCVIKNIKPVSQFSTCKTNTLTPILIDINFKGNHCTAHITFRSIILETADVFICMSNKGPLETLKQILKAQ